MPIVALAPLDIIAMALMALLLAYALILVVKALAQLLSHLPVVGGWVGDHLVGLSNTVANWVWDKFWGLAAVGGDMINLVWRWLKAAEQLRVDFAAAAAQTIIHVATVQVPREIAAARSYALGKVNAVRADLNHLSGSITADVLGKITAARTYAAHLVTAARKDLGADIAAAEAAAVHLVAAEALDVAAAVKALDAKSLSLFHAAEADATAALGAAEATAAAGLAVVRTEVATGLAAAQADAVALSQAAVHQAGVITDLVGVKALEGIWDEVTGAAGAVAGELPAALGDLEDLLKGLSVSKLAGLAGILSAVGAISLTQLRFLEECGLPNCRNLGPLAKFLESLLGEVEDVALLAFLVMMATDPTGAAHLVDEVAAPLVNDVAGGLRDLIGV